MVFLASVVVMNVTVPGCKTSVEVWDLIVFHLEIKFQTLNFVHVGKLKKIIFLKKWAGVEKKLFRVITLMALF